MQSSTNGYGQHDELMCNGDGGDTDDENSVYICEKRKSPSTSHFTQLKNNLFENNCNNGNGNGKTLPVNNRTFTHAQRDILRIIGQHLKNLGLSKTTESLVNESGCVLEHPVAMSFCNLIQNGEWDTAESLLNDLREIINSETDLVKMKFLIAEQKYMECLEDDRVLDALKCLRDELTPLDYNPERLHELTYYLMCTNHDDLKALSKWDGKRGQSRHLLLEKLQLFLPPDIMVPPRRLETLITQAIELQCELCPYHNIKEKPSIDSWCILRDHICTKEQFPTTTIQILTDHCDEVWVCKFSNNGTKLATGSKDGSLIVWDVNVNTLKLTLNKTYDDHTCGIGSVAWSPDDRYLIVCGLDECTELWIWDIEQKVLKKRFNHDHDDSLTTAAWLPDGQHFVAGGLKGQFYYCELNGSVKDTWEGIRVRCLQCLPDGTVLAADSLKRIRSYNFNEISDSNLIQEDFQIMSFSLNKTGTLALTNVSGQGLHLWDLKDRVLLRRYQGNVQNNFMNYSSIGGVDEKFIVSGSEDSRVYIWHTKKEHPICTLEGHKKPITCVSWNPVIPGLVASASDDGTVRIWGPSQYVSSVDDTTSQTTTYESVKNPLELEILSDSSNGSMLSTSRLERSASI